MACASQPSQPPSHPALYSASPGSTTLDSNRTACASASDVTSVLANDETRDIWTKILEGMTACLRTQNTKSILPSIDHRRIDYFCHEWSSQEYKAVMEGAQPEFAAAAARFVSAWQHVGAAPPPLLAPKAVART